ncbi:hypothetical protein BPAE_0246g00110 [Botrytis paeoniae]|uniref:Uncharacterized protein n=1 Tax=Botrytis paeoniae TaxID=278948 RepID=A0A4Z1F8X9_9HELO|nr:hypothetical protein BPAE_0246g00110 [Botrytis paeoniae]
MSTDQLIVKLRYTKSQREMIEKIVNMESVVAREDVTEGQPIRDNKQDIAPSKLSLVKEKLLRIHRYLRRVNDDEKNTECLRIIPRVLQPENEKLEAANNELIRDVDKNEAEISELREEVGRIRDNESKLEEITNSLETSRNSTDKALNVLTSLKKKDNTYRERVLALKKDLKACKTERDEALANLDRQTESFENEHNTLIEENAKLKGTLTSFKRKLDDVMEDVEDATANKKSYGLGFICFGKVLSRRVLMLLALTVILVKGLATLV